MNDVQVWEWVIALVCAFAALGGETPEKPPEKVVPVQQVYRPFKELRDVLFYESFEHGLTYTDPNAGGKLTTNDQILPGGHFLALQAMNNNEHMVWARFDLTKTQLRVPNGFKPAELTVQLSAYADEPCEVTLKFLHAKGGFEKKETGPKVKTWSPVSMKLTEVRQDKKPPETDVLFTWLEVFFKPPKSAKKEPTVYIDDIIVTANNVKPEDVRPRLTIADKKRSEMERFLDRDGFTYSQQLNDYLKEQFKAQKVARKGQKNVLVAAATPEETQTWTKSLPGMVTKLKDSGYKFSAAHEADSESAAIGGVSDLRVLMPYNLQKETELALVVLSIDEAMGPERPADKVRVILERALAVGTIPIVVIPAPEKEDQVQKLAEFSTQMQGVCQKLGVPYVDAKKLAANAKGEFDPKAITPVAQDKLMLLVMTALKHCHDSMAKD